MRLRSYLLSLLAATALVTSGCASDGTTAPSPTPTAPAPIATATRPDTPTPSPPPPSATPSRPPTATATTPPSPTPPPATDTPTVSATPTLSQDALRILAPEDVSTVATFAFAIRVQVDPALFVPDTVAADVNGSPVDLSLGAEAGRYEAIIGPHAALRDDNLLTVTAARGGPDGPRLTRTASFRYLPPKARARRITDPSDLIRGPLADGRVGDYLLANAVARFVVQDAPQRDLYSVGCFGGNIIDVELVARPDLDNFLEMQPAVNIETVINAQSVEILNDGQNGFPAVLRACGPDDVLDFVNPSTIIEDIGGLPFPAGADDADYDIEGCTEYTLAPDEPYVKLVTTIFNNEDVARGFFVGDYINAAGEVDQWTRSGLGVGEQLTGDLGVLSFIGYGEATGIDYAHTTLPIPGAPIPGSSFFTAAGVSYVLQSNSVVGIIVGGPPTFLVPAGGSNSYTRFFGVGDGSGGNAVDLEHAVTGAPVGALRGCATIGGAPAAAARVSVGPLNGAGAITGLASIFVTDPAGCYEGTLRPGTYGVAVARRGAPYEGGGAAPLVHPVTITAGAVVIQDLALPATGRVRVAVVDEDDAPVPARVSVIGFDPSPEPVIPGGTATGLFYEVSQERYPFGFVALHYADAQGRAAFDLEPGTYQLAVSRGTEYSLFEQPITVAAGEPLDLRAQIARVVDTPGFVSSDYHVHGIASADSRVSHHDRVVQFAGEGVDNIIMTDHHAHTDLTPTIAALGFTPFVRATVGEEITTWDYGHFNAYPLRIDPERPSGGSTDWGGAAPAGRDFRAYGAFSLTPQEIQTLATAGAQSTPDTTIQINHIDSFFDPLRIDTGIVPPQSFISAPDKFRFRLDPDSGNLFAHFPALEVWNGASRGKQSEFLDLRLGIWFNHLNQGLLTTAVADTDTHEFLSLATAGARTWTASPTDDPAEIDPADIARAIVAGRAVGGQGAYVQTRLLAGDDSGAAADLTSGGSTLVATTNGSVTLEVRAQAPLWAPFDRIEIYANAATVVARRRDNVPTLYGAEPTLVLVAGRDVPLTRTAVFPTIPGAERWESTFTVPFDGLTADTWFVVVVKGTDGVSRPMFPIMPDGLRSETNQTLADLIDGNLNEAGTLALGFTNALYADVDGVPGFQAPRQP